MTIVIQKKSVAIFDDDIIEKPTANSFNKMEISLSPFLNTASSHAFTVTHKYLIDKGLIIDEDNIAEFSTFIDSNDFIEKVVKTPEYQKLFTEPYNNLEDDEIDDLKTFSAQLLEYLELLSKKDAVFKPFIDTFSIDKFELELFNKRPANNNELAKYDVIVMDIMMGDDFDSIDKLAPYLGGIGDDKKKPIIFLISSRDELNEEKATYRAKAKSSSLAFAIINKATLYESNAQHSIQLQYEHMLSATCAAKKFNDFVIQFEKANTESTKKVEEELWSMDFSYLQQIYASTAIENYSFEHHMLGLVGSRSLFHIESSPGLSSSLSNLREFIRNENNKYQSFSSYSSTAVHDLESAIHFFGSTSPNKSFEFININRDHKEAIAMDNLFSEQLDQDETNKKLADIEKEYDQELANNIGQLIPYGSVLVKGNITNPEHILIHCTQLCDLSRNIERDDINLVYVEAKVTDSPHLKADIICIPLPTVLTNNQRAWLEIHPKKIIAKSIKQSLNDFAKEQYKLFTFLRFDIVRQIRNDIFQNLSRKESAIRTGHSSVKTKVIIKTIDPQNNQLTINEIFDEGSVVTLYQFNQTYHLLEQRHLDVIFWALQRPEIANNFSPSELGDILKNKLPKSKASGETIKKVKFVLCKESELDKIKLQSRQFPAALIFYEVGL